MNKFTIPGIKEAWSSGQHFRLLIGRSPSQTFFYFFPKMRQKVKKFVSLKARVPGKCQVSFYSKVPNNSAARLLIFSDFSLPTRLIWTYTLIKIQKIFLPTRLLSTIFYFFIYFQCFLQPFFITIASIMHYFHVFSSF